MFVSTLFFFYVIALVMCSCVLTMIVFILCVLKILPGINCRGFQAVDKWMKVELALAKIFQNPG